MADTLYVIGVFDTRSDGTVKREILAEDWRLPNMLASQFARECNEKYASVGRLYTPVKVADVSRWLAHVVQ